MAKCGIYEISDEEMQHAEKYTSEKPEGTWGHVLKEAKLAEKSGTYRKNNEPRKRGKEVRRGRKFIEPQKMHFSTGIEAIDFSK